MTGAELAAWWNLPAQTAALIVLFALGIATMRWLK